MKLYHGTNINFQNIDLARGRVGKDFGFGFYLTPDKQVAHRQAERKLAQYGEGDIVVKSYDWNENSLFKLNILRFDSYSMEWAEFVMNNRKNKTNIQLHDYDVVIGPIADDTVGFQIRRVDDGIIDMHQFLEEIKYNHITEQYLFATEKSLQTLTSL